MTPAIRVETARPDERETVFRLIFRHLDEPGQADRVRTALQLLASGELDPDGLFVVRRHGIVGAVASLAGPGRCGVLWPPQSVPPRPDIEDALVQHAVGWLTRRGSKLFQCLLAPEEQHLAAPLLRNGLPCITDLWYFRHDLDHPFLWLDIPERLRYAAYAPHTEALFHRVLLATYEGTLDCPEIGGVRTVEEILEGHRAQGEHHPEMWWLAFHDGEPVGLILLSETPGAEAWDVMYVGVVPEARRRGWAREMMLRALRSAHAADAAQVTLAVDARNLAAWKLYTDLGFRPVEKRHVYLSVRR